MPNETVTYNVSEADWSPSVWDASIRDAPAWEGAQRLIAATALVFLTPLFLLLYMAVKLTSKGPFLFRQERPGKDGRPFTALKVRTMRIGADRDKSRARKVDLADPMITPIGRILRDLKLDELPQLVNVLRGEMAIVGPRPIATSLQRELEGKIPGFARRLSVKPGLTSLGQVCLMDNADDVVADWSMRFDAELDYLYRRNWKYDLVIIAMTVLFLGRKMAAKLLSGKKLIMIAFLLGCVATTGCSERLSTAPFTKADGAYEKAIPAFGDRAAPSVPTIEPISIPVEEDTFQDPEYRVGTGDLIAVNVFGEEGLSDLKVSVDGAGYVQLPYLERVKVAGKTTADIQAELKSGFNVQFRNPWVVVEVIEYRSRPIYLLGEFNKPGVVYLDGPTNLMQAITMGSGLSGAAHLRGARLWRNDAIAAVDLHALLMEGRAAHNVGLQPGDTIFVPSQADKKAYVLGAVARAGTVQFSNEPMTLLKALSQVGGPIKEAALLSQVRVIRTLSPVDGQLILVNANDILKGKAADLTLIPDDIVYVPNNMIENWNQVVRAITPSLQLAGGVLQPVVQVKFLKGN
ncbi:MAG: sugar transferase [Alphaproteobacteria bacterium]|nr:sugar transferase [Alphaproteobacteria bacterium]